VSGDSEPIKNVFYSHNYIKCPSFKSKYKEMAVVLMIKVLDRALGVLTWRPELGGFWRCPWSDPGRWIHRKSFFS
jgi:hypothetical protein